MDTNLISVINRARSAEWHKGGEPWTLADWSNAMCGEAGELANVVKKIRRIETNTHGRYAERDRAKLVEKAKKEVADVYLYLDLLLEQLDAAADMDEVVAAKFNETSIEYGFSHRLIPAAKPVTGEKYTWATVPIGYNVPGSGEIISKDTHLGGVHITFRRTEEGVFKGEEWATHHLAHLPVPIALTERGLVY